MTNFDNILLLGAQTRVPLGVVFFVYESRPNVTADAAAICAKAGNAVILRGGKEAIHSSQAIVKLLHEAAAEKGLPADAVQLVSTTDREAVGKFLQLPEFIDVAIPRGGEGLIRRVAAEAQVEALKVAEDLFERRACANCHVVTKDESNSDAPWQVAAVELTESFQPHANFSHAAHQTEISGCDNCHAATSSTTAEDLLIPGIDTCRDCHGSGISNRNAAQQTPSTCVMCHSFHFDAKESYP